MDSKVSIDSILNGFEPFYYYYLRYVIIAGVFYALYYIVNKDKWIHKKIQKKFPKNESIFFEIKNSIISLAILALMGLFVSYSKEKGWTQIYSNVDEYGVPYLIFSVAVLILAHDTYFYWAHRFMHLKWVYPHVHLVHHKSTSPTPWASFSFHPIEAFLEGFGVMIMFYFIPLHMYAIWAFLIFMTIFNVMGHLGFEVFVKGSTRSSKWWWHNTVTHHDMHHKYFNHNYGLYFNWWDKWMKTLHEKYHDEFDAVAGAKSAKKLTEQQNSEKLDDELIISQMQKRA